jgi:tRNA (guanine10-N2)-methyltransferase
MKDPSNEFILIRETELDATGCPQYPRHGIHKELIPENDARPPLAVYFGRVLGQGRSTKGRGGIEEYSLSKRSYLGPTSMDTELSFIMTNLGQVQKSSFVMDPFVGTGSILLSCALRGAYCMGTDIDLRVLKGKSKEENVKSNFRQYGLPPPELIRSDNAIYHRHYRSHEPLYDSIICDPPYGIRAGARKTGSRREETRPVLDEHRHDHIAQTKPYAVSDVMADLLDMSARTLVMNGRLVYIIPSFKEFNVTTDLPIHDCLELVHVCYQPLSAELGRRMVTMKKIREYYPSKRTEYLSKVWVNGAESAEKCANIRDKILEAAKLKPRYEEKAAIRKQKRKANREAKKKAKRVEASAKSELSDRTEKRHRF